jgi:hypothetical protein
VDDAASFVSGTLPPTVRLRGRARGDVSPRDIALALDPRLAHPEPVADRKISIPAQASSWTGSPGARRDTGFIPAHGNARMPQPADDDDSTIRLTKPVPPLTGPQPSPQRLPVWIVALPVLLVVLAVAGAWLVWRPASPPEATPAQLAAKPVVPAAAVTPPETGQTPAPAQAVVLPAAPPSAVATPILAPSTNPAPPILAFAPAPPGTPMPTTPPAPATRESGEFKIESAGEQTILEHVLAGSSDDVTVFRFRPNPRILVLDFKSLRDQGLMFNRAAALVEKAGLPHDRLLSDIELDAAVRAGGDTVETFYYGHDYGIPSLIRFFALAERDDIPLLEEEKALRALISREGWFEPNAHGGIISVPQVGADEHVTWAARTTILHHELSHGEYFSNPAYAAFVHRFWTQTLSPAERDRIRHHLHSLGYDSSLEEVMENEAQAYLMFTESADFFTPEMIGMTKARLSELRNGFFRTMPAGWLRDSLGQTLGANKAAARP